MHNYIRNLTQKLRNPLIMKKLILITFTLFAFAANAQTDTTVTITQIRSFAPEDGFGLPVLERSPEVFSHKHICREDPIKGICEVHISCTSDMFPIKFIQGGVVLETIYDKHQLVNDTVAVIKNVKYRVLPKGGFYYQLDAKNPVGRTTLLIQRGE